MIDMKSYTVLQNVKLLLTLDSYKRIAVKYRIFILAN